MKKVSKPLVLSLAFILIVLSLFLLNKSKNNFIKRSVATVGEDNRFRVRDSKWADLFNGVVFINHGVFGGCTGFLLEGDIIVTAGHCFSSKINSYLNKDASINYEKLKRVQVYLDDVKLSDLFKEENDLNGRPKPYSIKDVFIGANSEDCEKGAKSKDFFKDDFAFIKLNEPIPKKHKRFKLLKDINFKDYKFLDKKVQKGLSISIVGFPADIRNSERLAHVGCKVRSLKQYKKVWSLFTDCDTEHGSSGSPAFRILENKKTKEIELGILGVLTSGIGEFGKRRSVIDKDKNLYELSGRSQYHLYPSSLERDSGQYSRVLSLNNHLFFNETLKGFKENPSQWRNRKVPLLKKYNYLKEDYLKTKIKSYDIKKLKEFLNFLENQKIFDVHSCGYSAFIHLSNMGKSDNLKEEKKEILNNFVEKIEIQEREEAKKLLNKRKKHLSYKNIMKAYGVSFIKENGEFKKQAVVDKTYENSYLFNSDDFEKEDQIIFPLEDLEKDKEQSDKLWHDYFGE